jgi:hypothetical protein
MPAIRFHSHHKDSFVTQYRAFITRSLSRRHFLQGGASLPFLALLANRQSAAAQRMDPFTYIRTMPATTDIGQTPGQAASEIAPVNAGNQDWHAYIQLPIKEGQYDHFTCEFDSAEIILRAYGSNLTLDDQMELVGQDNSIEPVADDSGPVVMIHGGDIDEHFCGYVDTNILSRARGNAVRKVFDHEELKVTAVDSREGIESALLAGEPVWFKSTVDFLDWDPSIWITPDGDEFPVVHTNDHALIVMGFNEGDVIIRDPLGVTSTNDRRPWQYTVSWDRFLDVFAAQGNDGLAVGPRPATPGDGTQGAIFGASHLVRGNTL